MAGPPPGRWRAPRVPAWAWIGLAALAVRAWGLAQGLPDAPHPDEPILVRRALRFGGGDLNPHFFYYPSFAMYLSFVGDGFWYLFGRLTGRFDGAEAFAVAFVRDPTPVYLVSRFLSAAADAGTAALVTGLGGRFFGPLAGAAAGGLWAVFPLAQEYAQLAKPDAVAAFLGVAAFALLVRGDGARPALAAGLAWGLAASTKYNAVLLGPAFLLWIWLAGGERSARVRVAAGFLGAGALGFFLGTPFALLDASTFLHDFREQTVIMGAGVTGLAGGSRGWLTCLRALLAPGGSAAIGLLTAAGLAAAAQGSRRVAAAAGLGLVTFYLALAPNRIASPHYLLMAFPLQFLVAGAGCREVVRRFGRAAGALALVLAAAPLLWSSAERLWRTGHADSRIVARRWIERTLPPGSAILTDASGPQLWMERAQIADLLERARQAGHVKADLFALQLKGHPGGGYRTYLTEQPVMVTPPDLLRKSRAVQDLLPIDRGLAAVRAAGVRYVVTAGEREAFGDPAQRGRYPAHAAFYDELDRSAKRIARFETGPWLRPGPPVSVYDLSASP